MEERGKGEMRKKRKASLFCLQLLALLQVTAPSSAQTNTTANTTSALSYRTHPADLTVAVGEPAVFRCGVPKISPNFTFSFLGSHNKYILTCPSGYVEDIPKALYGSCEMKNGESLAAWTLKGTSFSDNGTSVVCQQSMNPNAAAAVLYVYDKGTSKAILIGCTIGGFFGMLLVFGLSFTILQRSETLQRCYRGKEAEDDVTTIVTKE